MNCCGHISTDEEIADTFFDSIGRLNMLGLDITSILMSKESFEFLRRILKPEKETPYSFQYQGPNDILMISRPWDVE